MPRTSNAEALQKKETHALFGLEADLFEADLFPPHGRRGLQTFRPARRSGQAGGTRPSETGLAANGASCVELYAKEHNPIANYLYIWTPLH